MRSRRDLFIYYYFVYLSLVQWPGIFTMPSAGYVCVRMTQINLWTTSVFLQFGAWLCAGIWNSTDATLKTYAENRYVKTGNEAGDFCRIWKKFSVHSVVCPTEAHPLYSVSVCICFALLWLVIENPPLSFFSPIWNRQLWLFCAIRVRTPKAQQLKCVHPSYLVIPPSPQEYYRRVIAPIGGKP